MSGGHNRWNGEAVTASSTQDFREAMSAFPSGVTVVTTTDAEGRWWGFTATSFCSVSAEPPLVLVCLAETAECHPVFAAATDWIIHVLAADHGALALRFATRGADKFGESDFVAGPNGLPVLSGSCVTLHCRRYASYAGGDHTILVGEVLSTEREDAHQPALYYRRRFHGFQLANSD
jgi:flavin reductase ActVB